MHRYPNFQPRINFNIKERIRGFLRSKNPTNRLIVINVCVYLLIVLVRILSKTLLFLHNTPEEEGVDNFILQWLGVSSHFDTLISRPWTLITSIFLHLDFMHILINMIMLWLAGWIFSQYLATKQIYWIYLWGGIVGNTFFILSYNYFPVFESIAAHSCALGASGGVLAVLAAAATKVPNYPVRLFLLGEVRLKWIAIVLIVLDIINIPHGNSGGHFAHLGGALFGFLFVLIPILRKKIHLSVPKKGPRYRQKNSSSFRPKTDEQYNAERTAYRKQVDTILDKVAKSGYSSLSKEEKDLLFNTSSKKNW